MKKYFMFLTCVFIFLIQSSAWSQNKVRVACIGNSVTFGYGIENREQNCYPTQLQNLLGDAYEVKNFGHSGATLLKKGHNPYWEKDAFAQAKAFKPEIVILHLGLNDTDPRNWPNYKDEFKKDYYDLIDAFCELEGTAKPKVWICRLTPIFNQHPRFKSGTRDWFWQIQEQIEQIAEVKQVGIIDLHTPLYCRPDLFPDALHPNAEGAKILATTVYQEVSGNYGGLSLPVVFGDHMVLQRQVSIPVYGMANAGDKVSVFLNDLMAVSQANVHGKWKVELPAMKAGGPYELRIESKNKTIVFQDVLIGEVWLCSGQSNMAFTLKESSTGKEDITKANRSNIRLYNMKAQALPNDQKWGREVLKKVNQLDYFNSEWKACDSCTASEFSAIAYHFASGLQDSLNVPIGVILNAVGGSTTEAWIDRKSLEHHPVLVNVLDDWLNNDFVHSWCRKRARQNLDNQDGSFQRHPFQAAYLFETGIAPLLGFAIKGAIWYQGESNAHNVEFHEVLFPELVKSWRKSWGYDFPFYYVQLSAINRPSWGYFRDSQRRMNKLIPNSGMVVSSDKGHPNDVHPKNKKPIGERLARLSLSETYNFDLEYSGPVPVKMVFEKECAIVYFDHCSGMRAKNGDVIKGFEIAGSDDLFVPAEVSVNENTLILRNKLVKKITNVRYGWQAFNEANLVNDQGLPASTFSTEYNL
ncbi:GDSL-type esterase/lipase family protein [Labilibaculum sp. DW002]|uniref:GDSL-type esterase/lipase family protein n=1 Tax=Paralabilibaculum antarcticum TaxID=2912572 RepID=A0ABT5VMQ1_9BACT|nr:GDSL-type esterase/lipase family protein [Labilibaculum sp. DW002]MDE5416720.1 GDSL-type esterase/lipase family protein [Labilibaculum sp. DW002]